MEDFDDMYRYIIVGCGLSGSVIARYIAEELQEKVLILDRRNHIGGNMYDYVDKHGILVQKYGPHTFHTTKSHLFDYMKRYADWKKFYLKCMAEIDGIYTPSPFNLKTIDDFYSLEEADYLKSEIIRTYGEQGSATVLELLESENVAVRKYAEFLYEKDFCLYAAKQWGVSPKNLDPDIFKRVPIRFSYNENYFLDEFQVMPANSFTDFFRKLLDHSNITVKLNQDARALIKLNTVENQIFINDNKFEGTLVYTGALDELLDYKYGRLPYRSLRFEWITEAVDSFQPAPVVAYPQAAGYTRITEYKKLPVQRANEITSYAVEYSTPYDPETDAEPYYPILNDENLELYNKYKTDAKKIPNLIVCGRLGDYRYYNMDQTLERALDICDGGCLGRRKTDGSTIVL